jgi:hypothetical protein
MAGGDSLCRLAIKVRGSKPVPKHDRTVAYLARTGASPRVLIGSRLFTLAGAL